MDVGASREVGAASAESPLTPEAATRFLEAPQGWQKKVVPRKGRGGTPKRGDVVFVAPNGEEIKSKRQLERHLKANPGSPPLSDFDWSTGETPRRSERLSTKTRKSIDSPNAAPPAKRSKKTPAKEPKEDKQDTVVAPLEEGTPTKDKDHNILDTLPSKEATPAVESNENKQTDAKLFEAKESGKTESSEHLDLPEVVSNSKGEDSERKDAEEAVPVEETKADKETECKTIEEPSSWKDFKDNAVKESDAVIKGNPSEDGLVHDFKKEEIVQIVETKMESKFLETTKEDVDTEMKDPADVIGDYHENVVIEEETTVIVESTMDEDVAIKEETTLIVESTMDIEVANGVHRLEQNIQSEPPASEKAASEDLGSGESKKDVTNDGEQNATNASFSVLEIPVQDGRAEEIRTESDHSKPDMTSFLNVTKPQETRPAQVGVSS